jgi:hypothetical protein
VKNSRKKREWGCINMRIEARRGEKYLRGEKQKRDSEEWI